MFRTLLYQRANKLVIYGSSRREGIVKDCFNVVLSAALFAIWLANNSSTANKTKLEEALFLGVSHKLALLSSQRVKVETLLHSVTAAELGKHANNSNYSDETVVVVRDGDGIVMGGCVGTERRSAGSRRPSAFSDSTSSNGDGRGSGSSTKNRPLRHEKIRWKSDIPLTEVIHKIHIPFIQVHPQLHGLHFCALFPKGQVAGFGRAPSTPQKYKWPLLIIWMWYNYSKTP